MTDTTAETKKFKQALIDDATEFQKSAGLISFDEANKLWKHACDGPGVTETEFSTLAHILENFKFTFKGREYLDKLVSKQSSGSSMYKQIDGVKYDRSALDLAEHLVKDGKIDNGDAKKLWKDVEDGPGVTETEKRTIAYIRDKFTLTDGAKEYFAEKLGEKEEEKPAEGAKKEDKEEEKPATKAKTADKEEAEKAEKAEPMEEEEAEKEAEKEEPKEEEEEEEETADKAKESATSTPSRPSRERKQVEQFVPSDASTREEKPFVVAEGKGTALGDIPNVDKRLNMTKAGETHIKKLHTLIFPGQKAGKTVVKAHIRQFKGFDPSDEKVSDDCQAKLSKMSLEQLKPVMDLLDIQCTGSKEDKINAIVDFLKLPEDSGKDFQFKKAVTGTKRKASTKKKKASKKKKVKSDKPRKLSAFMHFGMDQRPKIKQENPDATFGELGKLLGAAWRGLKPAAKEKWQTKADNAAPVEKKKKATPKKPAKKKAKKSKKESSEEEESEEEEEEQEDSDSDAPLSKGMSQAMKDKIKDIITNTDDLSTLTRKQIKAQLKGKFDDVDDHNDELKEFIVKCVKSKK